MQEIGSDFYMMRVHEEQITMVGRQAILTEINGLKLLARALDLAFVSAIEHLAAMSGRVIITGMFKSGHIGRKISATFASTTLNLM